MRSPRWRKVLGDLRAHRGRTAVVIVAIAVGLAGVAAILDSWALIRVATAEGFRASDPAAATIRVDSVTDALLARVRAFAGVRDAQARRTTMARAQLGGTTLTAMLFTVDDREPVRVGKVVWEHGGPPADGTLTVERSSLAFSGAAFDEEIRLSVGDHEPVAIPVRGIARDVGLAPGWMEHLLYGFVSRSTLGVLGAPATFDELRIVFDEATLDQQGARAMAFALQREIEAAGHAVRDVDVPVPGEHVHAAQMNSLLYTQFAFALMALVLSAFLVVNLIAAMLAGQTREIGVMKAIGARPSQLAVMYLTLAAALGVAATVVALPVARVAGRRYAALRAEFLNFEIAGFAVPGWVVALEIAAGILLPVLAAAVPVWRSARISVNDALRDVGIVERPGDGMLQRVRGLPRPLLLALRNAFRKRRRTVLTLVTLAAGGAVFLGALNLRAGVLRATDALFAAQHFDVSLRLSAPQHPDSLESIARAVAGVEGAEAWSGARATIDRGDGTTGNAFTITAPPADTRLLALRIEEGRWLRGDDTRALVIGRTLQRVEPGLHVGATVPLRIAGRTDQWTIVGVAEAGVSPMAYTTRGAVATLTASNGAATVVVRSARRDEGSQLDLISRLRVALAARGVAVASSTRVAESKRSVDDHLLMVVQFLGAMAWLMILVGGLALASTMGLAVLERTREIGVLKAIGARHGAILALIQGEGLTIALASWLVAIPLAAPMSLLLGKAFSRIMLPVPVSVLPDTSGVLIWLALVIAVSVIACLWPATRAMRVPAAAALSYE